MAENAQKAKAQALAEQVGAKLCAQDAVVQSLGISLDSIGPGQARLVMTVGKDMINGAGICHGGVITTLADAAFAFACNSHNKLTLATGISVEFLAPAHQDDVLTASADEVSRGARTGLYDVTVTNQNNKTVAVLRGRCHEVSNRSVV